MDEDTVGQRCGVVDPSHAVSPKNPRLVCPTFYVACKNGIMIANTEQGGWNRLGMQYREMTKKARWYATERNPDFTDHSGEPYLLTEICPWCGGELPIVAQRKQKQHRLPPGEGDGS